MDLLQSSLVLAVILILLMIGNIEMNPGPGFVFVCREKLCGFCTTDIKAHVSHQRIHSSSSNFTFKCPWPTCHFSFDNYKNAYQHVHTKHAEKNVDLFPINTRESSTSKFMCSVSEQCGTFESPYDICQHVIGHLERGESLPLECPLKCVAERTGKTSVFRSVSVFRTHLAVKHKGWTEKVLTVSAGTSSNQNIVPETPDESMDIDAEGNDDDFEEFYDAESGDEDLFSFDSIVSSIAKFYLMLEGELFLPLSTVQNISGYLRFISELVQIKTEASLKKELDRLDITPEKRNQILKRVLMADPLFAAHHEHSQGPTLTTDHRRRRYYKENYGYVDVTQINVCPRDLEAKMYAHYIPLKKTLDVVLQDQDVKEQILASFNKPASDPDLIDDYTKGSLYLTENEIEAVKSIDIVIFIDAFNMVNPLGAAKNLYKSVGVYMSILNLKPFNRAKLDAMHLVMLVQEKFLESCNHTKCNVSCSHIRCFRKIVDDLNDLFENGVMFCGEIVRVRLRFVAGDSLGAHQIGGLLRNFSKAKYFCRFCEIYTGDFKVAPHTSVGEERTVANYSRHVRRLKLKRLAGQKAKSSKGIRVDSILNTIKGFHVAAPALPPCLGHDLFEGVATWDLRFVIDYCIDQKWFTHDEFVQLLKEFSCKGYDCGNKPKCISKESSKGLGLHAVQVWFVLRMLPFLVGDKIADKSNEIWIFYLKLKKLTEYICAPKLTRFQIEEMRILILDYMATRIQLNLDFKPKHHFLLHYDTMFLKLGPLIHLWGMRFESMHSIFKRIALLARNFINITLTMARKYQLRLAYQSTGPLFKTGVLPSSQVKLCDASLSSDTQFLVRSQFSDEAIVVHQIEYNSLKFEKGSWVLFGFEVPNQIVLLGRIALIICDGPDVRFVLKTTSATFVDTLGLYKINENGGRMTLLAASTVEYQPQPVYKFRDHLLFSLKTQLQVVA